MNSNVPHIQRLEVILKKLGVKVNLQPTMHLRDNLNLDSLKLMKLTILINEEFGVNLGILAEEKNLRFDTIQDILAALQ